MIICNWKRLKALDEVAEIWNVDHSLWMWEWVSLIAIFPSWDKFPYEFIILVSLESTWDIEKNSFFDHFINIIKIIIYLRELWSIHFVGISCLKEPWKLNKIKKNVKIANIVIIGWLAIPLFSLRMKFWLLKNRI